MDKSDRPTPLYCPQQRAAIAFMGKGKSMLRSSAACVPVSRLRSNQDDEGDGSNDSCHVSTTTTGLKTMQRSTSAFDPRHEAATASSTTALGSSKSVVVLRRCEDLNIRTGGFQKIEEAAHRLDIRRPRQPQQSPARQEELNSQLEGKVAGLRASKLT